jgi:DNA-binding NarL/FixJ family response regulator
MQRPRVLLADDHALLLEAFERLLERDCDVVGKVADGAALVEQAAALHPDAIVADIGMPGLNGLEAARAILHRNPGVRIVFLTVAEEPGIAAEAFRLGAAGYLLKRSAAGELLQALSAVLANQQYLTPLVARGGPAALKVEAATSPLGQLSPREREVLQLLAAGQPMKGVARQLGITARTVAFHKYRVRETLGLRSDAEMVQFAVRHWLV